MKDRPNRVDNSEQVLILEPAEGVWQIQVEGHIIQETQSYSLVSSYNIGIGVSEENSEDAVVAANSVIEPSGSAAGSGGGGALGFYALAILLMSYFRRKTFKI